MLSFSSLNIVSVISLSLCEMARLRLELRFSMLEERVWSQEAGRGGGGAGSSTLTSV